MLIRAGLQRSQAQENAVRIRFSQIQVNGFTVMPQPGQPLLLQRAKNTLLIQFEDPFPGKHTTFAYKIEPDSAWHSLGSGRQVLVHNLPAENCVLWVKALNTPLKAYNHLELIGQPFWQKVWFWPVLWLLMTCISGLFGYLFYLYRIRQFMRLQRVRDQIARDLHDDMGSYLSSISILSQTATTDPARTRQTLDRIGQTARQVMASMSDIVWSVNPAQDSMPQILDRMRQVADSLFEQSGTHVSFDIGPGVDAVTLSLERRRDFYLIYKEAMTNACRYASASRVRVSLLREGGWLTLTVQDNGRGFDPENPTSPTATNRSLGGGNGLPNMQNRAALLGGTLTIESAPGQGCTVRLRLPA
jgi:two-component sensor histidine kinase